MPLLVVTNQCVPAAFSPAIKGFREIQHARQAAEGRNYDEPAPDCEFPERFPPLPDQPSRLSASARYLGKAIGTAPGSRTSGLNCSAIPLYSSGAMERQ